MTQVRQWAAAAARQAVIADVEEAEYLVATVEGWDPRISGHEDGPAHKGAGREILQRPVGVA